MISTGGGTYVSGILHKIYTNVNFKQKNCKNDNINLYDDGYLYSIYGIYFEINNNVLYIGNQQY